MFLGSLARAAAGVLVLSMLGACAIDDQREREFATGSLPPLSDARPQDQPLELAKRHFAKSDYGLAERYFRAAVEANAKSSEAWLGLAASYDRLRRFDLAERAYRQVLALEGRSPTVLNNLGYHHMLRGNLKLARTYLSEAARKDPGNPQIQGNLYLLETWKGNGEVGDAPPEQGETRPARG